VKCRLPKDIFGSPRKLQLGLPNDRLVKLCTVQLGNGINPPVVIIDEIAEVARRMRKRQRVKRNKVHTSPARVQNHMKTASQVVSASVNAQKQWRI
jgi:hypothetical protein